MVADAFSSPAEKCTSVKVKMCMTIILKVILPDTFLKFSSHLFASNKTRTKKCVSIREAKYSDSIVMINTGTQICEILPLFPSPLCLFTDLFNRSVVF